MHSMHICQCVCVERRGLMCKSRWQLRYFINLLKIISKTKESSPWGKSTIKNHHRQEQGCSPQSLALSSPALIEHSWCHLTVFRAEGRDGRDSPPPLRELRGPPAETSLVLQRSAVEAGNCHVHFCFLPWTSASGPSCTQLKHAII